MRRRFSVTLDGLGCFLGAGLSPVVYDPGMKLADYIPLYFELHVNIDNRVAVAYKKRHDIEREFIALLGGRELEAIKPLDVRRLIAGWTARDLSPKTMNNYLCLLRNILKCAVQDEAAETACFVETRKIKQQPQMRALTRPELETVWRVIRHEAPHWKFMVQFALLTGLRIGELRTLLREDVRDTEYGPELHVSRSTSGRFAIVGPTKGGAVRALPVGEPVLGLVNEFHTGTKLMFADTRRGVAAHMLTYKACDCAIRRIREAADLPWLHWHTFRHTHATILRSAGVPMAHIQAFLGHVDARTTARYAHAVTSEMRDALGAFASRLPKLLKNK